MSRAADRSRLQFGRNISAGLDEESGISLDRTQSSRLGSTKHHLPDGIMARNVISIASTSYLVVSKNISRVMALWAVVERETQPILQKTSEFSI